MKNENRYSGSYFCIPFSVFKLGKGKRKLDYPILIFHYGIGEWKTKGRYIQHVVVFRLSCFHLAIEKNENGYNGSYFYFSFFVWGLEKRKRMLSYPFSIFYYEIEKRKTKGRYIHGPPDEMCCIGRGRCPWQFYVFGQSSDEAICQWMMDARVDFDSMKYTRKKCLFRYMVEGIC